MNWISQKKVYIYLFCCHKKASVHSWCMLSDNQYPKWYMEQGNLWAWCNNILTNSQCSTQAQVDGLVQERRNSSALAMELRLSCTNLSKYPPLTHLCAWTCPTCAVSRWIHRRCWLRRWKLLRQPGIGLWTRGNTRRPWVTCLPQQWCRRPRSSQTSTESGELGSHPIQCGNLQQEGEFNSLAYGRFKCNFRHVIFNPILVIDGQDIFVKLPSGDCHWTSLMTS